MKLSNLVTTALASFPSLTPHPWQPTSTYSPFVRSGALPTIAHPPYMRTEHPEMTTRVVTLVETVASPHTTFPTEKPKDPKPTDSGEYYTTTVAYGTYGVITVTGKPHHPNTFNPGLSLSYNPAAATSNTPPAATATSTNVLAGLDPKRPKKGLVFAIQRYADANCADPIGPRFAYDGSQNNSCFFKKGSCRGSCAYLKHKNGQTFWNHDKKTLSKKRLEQYDFASWDYKLVTWDEVWGLNNRWQPAAGHMKHKHKKWMFPEANNEGGGSAVCDATFWQERDCKENSKRPESGQVMKWRPQNLRVDEGKCMNGFKNPRGVPAMAASFRIECFA